MLSEEIETLIVLQEEAGERLDKILANRFSEVRSRSYFQYLIEAHLVLLNGEPIKKRIKPKVGDEIEIQFALTPEIDLTPENIPLNILYEDESLLVINKPAGMVVHPAPGNWSGTFVNALLYHCQKLEKNDSLRPGIVHRLDKDTSGVLVAAKTTEAQQKLVEQFAAREVYKEYLAICIGNPGQGKIEAAIGRHPVDRKQMAVVSTGRSALTFFETKKWNDKLSVVKVTIATGRTHQIRVHMKHQGTPILGDVLYGQSYANKHYKTSHQMLHAAVLRIKHPINGQEMEFKAAPPEDMQQMIDKILPRQS